MNQKICIVSSCGGHLTEVRCLLPAYRHLDHFYVLNDKVLLHDDMLGKTFFIAHSERDWKFLKNIFEAVSLLRNESPTIIISTGAGPIVPFALVARLFFDTKIIFIETITRTVRPSLTGRIMYWLAHDYFYQWESLRPYFPKGKFGGPLI